MLYIRTHILHIRYIRTYIYIKWRKQKNKKKHHLIITHCSRRFHTNGIIEFRITCVWQESTSQGGSWRREASSFFFFFFHFMYQLLCLCQYVSKNKTLSFSGVCFNPNRNATAITQHVSLKFVEQTIGNNEPTESVVSSFPSLPLPLCFLSFFFFFVNSLRFTCVDPPPALQVGEHVRELYVATMFVLHECICTSAQIKPQINRSGIRYFVHSRLPRSCAICPAITLW